MKDSARRGRGDGSALPWPSLSWFRAGRGRGRPRAGRPGRERATGHPDLFVRGRPPAARGPAARPGRDRLRADLAALGISAELGAYDLRAGRWGCSCRRRRSSPGPGWGTRLTLGRPRAGRARGRRRVQGCGLAGLHGATSRPTQAVLGVSRPELARAVHRHVREQPAGPRLRRPRVRRRPGPRQLRARRRSNSGNLVLYGTRNWGTIDISTTPSAVRAEPRATSSAPISPVST